MAIRMTAIGGGVFKDTAARTFGSSLEAEQFLHAWFQEAKASGIRARGFEAERDGFFGFPIKACGTRQAAMRFADPVNPANTLAIMLERIA